MRTVMAIAVLALLAGCGERPQEPTEAKRSYQGKRDTLPWDNAPPVAELRGSQWNKGDRTSWEESIKSRQLAQHEHRRIYQ
jgi:hypothetical protein